MKAVPILAITNALALGLVVVLYVQQGELEDRLKSSRAASPRSAPLTVDEAELEARILDRLRGFGTPDYLQGSDADQPEAARETEGGEPSAGSAADQPAGSEPSPGVLEGRRMETFRRNVRRANELVPSTSGGRSASPAP
jgi:hypothetical protein